MAGLLRTPLVTGRCIQIQFCFIYSENACLTYTILFVVCYSKGLTCCEAKCFCQLGDRFVLVVELDSVLPKRKNGIITYFQCCTVRFHLFTTAIDQLQISSKSITQRLGGHGAGHRNLITISVLHIEQIHIKISCGRCRCITDIVCRNVGDIQRDVFLILAECLLW